MTYGCQKPINKIMYQYISANEQFFANFCDYFLKFNLVNCFQSKLNSHEYITEPNIIIRVLRLQVECVNSDYPRDYIIPRIIFGLKA